MDPDLLFSQVVTYEGLFFTLMVAEKKRYNHYQIKTIIHTLLDKYWESSEKK